MTEKELVTLLVEECIKTDSTPVQYTDWVRKNHKKVNSTSVVMSTQRKLWDLQLQ